MRRQWTIVAGLILFSATLQGVVLYRTATAGPTPGLRRRRPGNRRKVGDGSSVAGMAWPVRRCSESHQSALAPVPPVSPSPAARTPAVSGLGLAGPPMPGPRVGRVSDDLGNERATGRDDRVGAFGRAGLLLQPAALRRFGLGGRERSSICVLPRWLCWGPWVPPTAPIPAVLAGAVDDRPVLHGPPRTGVDGLALRVQLGPLSQHCGPVPALADRAAERHPGSLFAAGLALGLAILTRVESWVLVAAPAAVTLLLESLPGRRRPWSEKGAAAGCFLFGLLLVLGPYLAASGSR